jgi:hypothetical protein
MQSRRNLSTLIIIATVLLAVTLLAPFSAHQFAAGTSSPFARALEEALFERSTTHSNLFISADPDLDRGRFEEIVKLLDQIDIGQSALSLINQYDITVQFTSKRGSRFDVNTNQIFIDRSHESVMAALILVHEATHARYLHEGSATHIKVVGRETYITKKVQEEAMAVVNSIEAKMELEALGVDTDGQHATLETPYRQAYEIAMRSALADGASLNDGSAQTISRAAAQQTIFDALMNGKAVTSNTKQTYPVYWGTVWDEDDEAS